MHPKITILLNKHTVILLALFIGIIFLPTLVEHFIYARGELDLLPFAKLSVHIVVPLLFVTLLMGLTLKHAILAPFTYEKSSLLKTLQLGGFVGFMAMTAIFGGHVIFSQLIDSTAIVADLSSLGVDKKMFPLIALWVVFINPLMEEFFWRGFVYNRGMQLVSTKFGEYMILFGSGIIFALHHTIIIQQWFNWWQFLITTIFLAVAGVAFNLMYRKTGSIIPSLITHFMADLAIIVIGFQMFGFFTG